MVCNGGVFFNTKIQNNDCALEKMGNACFAPIRQIFGGREVIRIKNENGPDNYIVPPKMKQGLCAKIAKIALSIIFLIPGFIVGSLLKGLALLRKCVRQSNSNYRELFNKKTQANDFITQSNGDKFLLLGNKKDFSPTMGTYKKGYPWEYLHDHVKNPEQLDLSNMLNTHLASLFSRKGINWETVKTINLSGCDTLTDDTLNGILEKCPNIEELNIEGCKTLTADGIDTVITKGTKIKSLNLSNLSQGAVSKDQIRKATQLEQLKILFLDGSVKDINDATAKALGNSKSLKKLSLKNIENLRHTQVELIMERKNVKIIDVRGCKKISQEQVNDIRKKGYFVVGNDNQILKPDVEDAILKKFA